MSRAQTVPFEILTSILWCVLEDEPEYGHGGSFVQWDSNELVRDMAKVCVTWNGAANSVLYRSVAILGERTAELFLETAVERPDLVKNVRQLVVGLGKVKEEEKEDNGHSGASKKLVDVLSTCDQALHLHIRPVHALVRDRLIPILQAKSLLSFVYTPRVEKPLPCWSLGAILTHDLPLILSTSLTRLELDFDSPPATSTPPSTPHTPFVFPNIRLTHFCIRIEISERLLCVLLRAVGGSLELVHIYLEAPFFLNELADALLVSEETLRILKLISNPLIDHLPTIVRRTPSLADRILPSLASLTDLTISATEITVDALKLLPPSLRRLAVKTYTEEPALAPDDSFFRIVDDRDISYSLSSLKIRDSETVWTRSMVRRAAEACRRRGFTFIFVSEENDMDSD